MMQSVSPTTTGPEIVAAEIGEPVFFVCVGGTWSWSDGEGKWWHPGSDLSTYLMRWRLFPLRPLRPFRWSGRLGGHQFFRRLFGRKSDADHIDWKAGAGHLLDHLDHPDAPTPYHARNVLAHSYGGNVVFYACANGLKVRTLITFGTPVRADMAGIVTAARANIGAWVHVIDRGDDKWNRRGNFGDGQIEFPWRADQVWATADRTDDVDGIEHSKVLNEAKFFHHFPEQGWVHLLRTGSVSLTQPPLPRLPPEPAPEPLEATAADPA